MYQKGDLIEIDIKAYKEWLASVGGFTFLADNENIIKVIDVQHGMVHYAAIGCSGSIGLSFVVGLATGDVAAQLKYIADSNGKGDLLWQIMD